MPLPHDLFAPSFRRQRASLLFTVIVGFMVFAATLSVTAETTLALLGMRWDAGTHNTLTIEIPAVGDEASLSQNDRVQQTLAVLRTMPDIARATALTDSTTSNFLKPWIDDTGLLASLPIPTLIDVERTAQSSISPDDIFKRIHTIVPDAQVDDHAAWLGDLKRLVNGLIILSSMITLLAALTLAITVSLFCRAVMAGETNTIVLLHTMGANDADIARHFQSLAVRLSWPAAFIGFALALLGAGGILGFMVRFTDLGNFDALSWGILGGFALLVPMSAVLVGAVSARYSVTKLLQATP